MQIDRERHRAGHAILMVTHDRAIAGQADRRIELAHGRLAQDTATSTDDEVRFDHLLEQIWICGEEGTSTRIDLIRARGESDPAHTLGRLADLRLVEMRSSEVQLTDRGSRRARDLVRPHPPPERLFPATFSSE